MKVLAEHQNTAEWERVRRGRITASSAYRCLMGEHTKGRRDYIEKIADALEGLPDFDSQEPKPWFTDGIYYESFARGWYSFKFDRDVELVGFIVHDDYHWIGASPDGRVRDESEPNPDGNLEIKYRSTLHTFGKWSQTGEIEKRYKIQVQTQMFVTGDEWTDYVNYWRDDNNDLEKGHVQRIYRDDAYIENTLLPAFVRFWHDVDRELKARAA